MRFGGETRLIRLCLTARVCSARVTVAPLDESPGTTVGGTLYITENTGNHP
jgi:hypothetical protein